MQCRAGLTGLVGQQPQLTYLYDHPAGDREVGGGERRPEKGREDPKSSIVLIQIIQWNERGSFETYVNRPGQGTRDTGHRDTRDTGHMTQDT